MIQQFTPILKQHSWYIKDGILKDRNNPDFSKKYEDYMNSLDSDKMQEIVNNGIEKKLVVKIFSSSKEAAEFINTNVKREDFLSVSAVNNEYSGAWHLFYYKTTE